MPRKKITMRKIKEIFRLKYQLNLSNSKISKSLMISKSSVSKYIDYASEKGLSWEQVKDLSETELKNLLFFEEDKITNKSKKQLPDWKSVFEELKQKGVTLLLLWNEYKEEYPDGYKYSQYCDLYKKWRKKLNPSMRQNHKGGEKLFIDYAGVKVPIINSVEGKIRGANIFVATFGASNYFYTEAHFEQTKKNWINAHVRAFEYFRGVSEILVPDNLKAGVTSPCYYEPDINATYHEMSEHYNIVVIPARVRKPKDKAAVEVCVQVIEQSILAVIRKRQYFSISQLNKDLRYYMEQINNREMKHIGKSRKELFEIVDFPNLKPLPQRDFIFTEWKKAKVGIDYHVRFDSNFYSVPYKYIHSNTDIKATERIIEVFLNGESIASHMRAYEVYNYITKEEHMPQNHQDMLKWTPKRIKDWANKIGTQTGLLISELIKSRAHPEQAYRSCLGILGLAREYDNNSLELACKRANHFGSLSYKKVKNILKSGLFQEDTEEAIINETVSSDHSNLRGKEYYQSEADCHV